MARDDNTPSINLPEGQRIRWEGRLLTYRGRARDRARSHIFLDDAGVPGPATDQLLIAEQQAERLRLVTQEELDRADKFCRGTPWTWRRPRICVRPRCASATCTPG